MNKPKISIIVPIFNVEQYLPRCIDSILSQTYTDFELLLVDDGSPDRCGEICEEYARKDNRIRVFHKPNGGVSSARNLGLHHATGKWISFIDSDDDIGKDWYSFFFNEVDTDFIMQGYTLIDKGCFPVVFSYSEANYTKDDILQFVLNFENSKGYPLRTPWNKFFKKSIIDEYNISFDESVSWGEDYLFNLNYILHADSVKVLPAYSYMYERMETGLALKKYAIDEVIDWLMKRMEALVMIANRFNDEKAKDYFYKEYSLNLIRRVLDSTIKSYQLKNALENISSHIPHFGKYVCKTRYAIVFLPTPFIQCAWDAIRAGGVLKRTMRSFIENIGSQLSLLVYKHRGG